MDAIAAAVQGLTIAQIKVKNGGIKVKKSENMKDVIYREDAIEATWKEPSYSDPLNVLTEVRDRIEALPPVEINEVMILGYPARHLAFVAAVMKKEGVSPEEVASCLRDIGRIVGMVMAEQKEIIEKSWKEWGSV